MKKNNLSNLRKKLDALDEKLLIIIKKRKPRKSSFKEQKI